MPHSCDKQHEASVQKEKRRFHFVVRSSRAGDEEQSFQRDLLHMNSKPFLSTIEPADYLQSATIFAVELKDDGVVPNNARLPLLVYQAALKLPVQDGASVIEQLLETNKWGGAWRDGIYPYHHYHSTAHEILAVFGGSATVQLGGERGILQKLNVGDVIIIPAGVAHKRLEESFDFGVVGAYPEGQDWDICYAKAEERPKADRNIASVPLPQADPIYGITGPLMERWSH